jgi:hypothetical protein
MPCKRDAVVKLQAVTITLAGDTQIEVDNVHVASGLTTTTSLMALAS